MTTTESVTPVTEADTEPKEPFRKEGLGYFQEIPEKRVQLRADYLTRKGANVTAEISTFYVTNDGSALLLGQESVNISKGREKSGYANDLARRTTTIKADDWRIIIDDFCASVLAAERTGEPVIMVGKMPQRVRPKALVENLVEWNKVTFLYGPGGVGKGFMAVGIGVAVTTGLPFCGRPTIKTKVLYLDWEDDEEVLDERIKMVCGGWGLEPVEFAYMFCRNSLPHLVHEIARAIEESGAAFLVIDSVQAAMPSDTGTFNEATKQFFAALRYLGVTALCIDHVSEEGRRNDKGATKAYGDIFKGNWARLAWEVRADQEPNIPITHLALHQFKSNHGPKRGPYGFELDFRKPGQVHIGKGDISESAELSKRLATHERMAAELKRGPASTKELAKFLEVKEDDIRQSLKRYPAKFTRLFDNRIGLAYHEPTHLPLMGSAEPGPDDPF